MQKEEIINNIFKPSFTVLICLSTLFFVVFFGDFENILIHFFYNSSFFAFVGVFSVILLFSRIVDYIINFVKSTDWFENRKRATKGWPSKEEEFILQSLFYSGITFDELHKFANFAFDASFIAFTENSQININNYMLLARNDSEKYWLSYFRFSQREPARIKILYSIVSNFMEVLSGDISYKKELKQQAEYDLELKNIDTEKLLIAIISKEEIKKILKICDKYYKMIIDKKISPYF